MEMATMATPVESVIRSPNRSASLPLISPDANLIAAKRLMTAPT